MNHPIENDLRLIEAGFPSQDQGSYGLLFTEGFRGAFQVNAKAREVLFNSMGE